MSETKSSDETATVETKKRKMKQRHRPIAI